MVHLNSVEQWRPELNRIEIFWKHAKYFWHRFVSVNGADLLAEIQSLMKGFGSEFTVNLGGYLEPLTQVSGQGASSKTVR